MAVVVGADQRCTAIGVTYWTLAISTYGRGCTLHTLPWLIIYRQTSNKKMRRGLRLTHQLQVLDLLAKIITNLQSCQLVKQFHYT